MRRAKAFSQCASTPSPTLACHWSGYKPLRAVSKGPPDRRAHSNSLAAKGSEHSGTRTPTGAGPSTRGAHRHASKSYWGAMSGLELARCRSVEPSGRSRVGLLARRTTEAIAFTRAPTQLGARVPSDGARKACPGRERPRRPSGPPVRQRVARRMSTRRRITAGRTARAGRRRRPHPRPHKTPRGGCPCKTGRGRRRKARRPRRRRPPRTSSPCASAAGAA